MSRYFKFQSDSDLGVGIQYIEFNDSGWATRQAECYGDRWFDSTNTYHKELGSISLCDQQLTTSGMELGEQIDAKEFELAWKLSKGALVVPYLTAENKSQKAVTSPVLPLSSKIKDLLFLQKQELHRIKRQNWNLSLFSLSAGFAIGILGSVFATTNMIKLSSQADHITVLMSKSEEHISFKCNQYAGNVIMMGEIGKTKKTILNFNKKIRWNDEYSPINRCQMVASKINEYMTNDRFITITTGIKNGYDIICLSEGVGKGCLKDENNGQILTLGKSGTHSQQEYLENLIVFDPKEIRDVFTGSTITTSSRIYIDLHKLIQDGRDYYKIDPS